MILGVPTWYLCDGHTCDKIAEGFTNMVPKGWRTLTWRPGLLRAPEHGESTTKHFCSDACVTGFKDRINKPSDNPFI